MVDSLARIGGEERKCHIGKEANHKDCAYDVSYGFRDFREQIVERRSDEIHEKTSHYAEQQYSDEADSSVQIKEHIAVIPPLFVVHFFKEETCCVFDNRADAADNKECQNRLFEPSSQEDYRRHGARAVNRKPRTIHCAAIYDNTLFGKRQTYFPYPTDKCGGKEEQQHFIKGITAFGVQRTMNHFRFCSGGKRVCVRRIRTFHGHRHIQSTVDKQFVFRFAVQNGVRAQIHIILCLCAGIICVDVENIEQSDGEQTENTPPYERQIKRKRAPFLPFHHLF